MARSGVTYFDVSNAAESVRQQGHEPTVDRVREHLGTGSKSTLGPLLKRWREQQGDAVATGGLPGDLINAVRALHDRLQATADERIEAAKTELHAVVEELRELLGQTEAELKDTQQSEERLRTELAASTAYTETLEKDRDEHLLRAAKAEAQRDEAWSRISDLKTALAEHQQESRAAQERFEHYQHQMAEDRQRERDEARLVLQQHQGQLQQLMDQMGKAEARYANLLAEHKAQGQVLEGQRTKFHALQEDHVRAQADAEALARRLEGVIATRNTWQKQAEAAAGRAATLAAELATEQANARHLQQQLDQNGNAFAAASDRIEHLQDENRLLGQEKSVLEGRLKQLQQGL